MMLRKIVRQDFENAKVAAPQSLFLPYASSSSSLGGILPTVDSSSSSSSYVDFLTNSAGLLKSAGVAPETRETHQ